MGKKTKVKALKRKVDKPFADGTLSNSQFFGMIRSALRQKSRFFYSVKVARERARIPYIGPSKRDKWRYKCEVCGDIFPAKQTCVHHAIECGSLTSFEDLPEFTRRLFCSSDDLMLICNDCHNSIHGKNQ